MSEHDGNQSDEQSSGLGGLGGAVGGKAFDFARKLLTVGIGTAFLTEEALKALVTEFKIPKEMIGGILDSAKSIRKEFIQSFSSEMMSKISDKVDPAAIASQVLNDLLKNNEVTFEIKVKMKEKI